MDTLIIIPSQKLDIAFSDITIQGKNLHDYLVEIHRKAAEVVMDISIESQEENPDYTDIDAPLHGILNMLEEIHIRS